LLVETGGGPALRVENDTPMAPLHGMGCGTRLQQKVRARFPRIASKQKSARSAIIATVALLSAIPLRVCTLRLTVA
jgi:hypothetical protein